MPPRLSIIMPVYNEERTLLAAMRELMDACPEAQIIYVDDGSKDGSLALLHGNARPEDLVLTKENGGKGSAVRLGITQATGAFTAIQDADLEYDPREILSLLTLAEQNPGSVVLGSRFLRPNPNLYRRYLLGNKFVTGILNLLFASRLTDSYTCYKLFPTDLLRSLPLTARGFELEAELCCYPLARGITMHEVPITYHPRSLEEGKKIRFADAWKGCLTGLLICVRERSFLRTHRHLITQFLRYLASGGTAAALELLSYKLLLILGVHYLVATPTSAIVGIVSAFLLHKYLVFRKKERFFHHAFRYGILTVWNILAQILIVYVLVDHLSIGPMWAKVIGIGVVVSWNFFFYKFLVYV
ncbi:MAG: bifunctional glycosyltransferase family 2/GtrA family protein [Candidatus Peribacteraceae bacterium]